MTSVNNYDIIILGGEELPNIIFLEIYGDDEMGKDFSKTYTFVTRKLIGKCKCCEQQVFDNQLFVEEENNVYHYSCFNEKAKEEQSGK